MVRVAIALVCLLLLLPSAAWAQARIALIVTNQAYTQAGARLTNTHRDGELVKAALEKVGFRVWVATDTSNERTLLAAIAEHVRRLAEAGPEAVGFFYYSGHGAADRPNGENYLVPTDVPLTHASQLPLLAVRLEKVTSSLAGVGSMGFVVFDACRNVPLQRDNKDLAFKGLAPVREQNGLLVAFATEPGNVAVDQSLYAKALAEEVVKPGLEAGQVFRRVRLRVRTDTRQSQSPEYLDKRDHDFHFAAPGRVVTHPPPAPGLPPAAAVSIGPAPFDACDALAANPDDPEKRGAGTKWVALKAAEAVAACQRALQQYPNEKRFKYQLARAYQKAATPGLALPLLEELVELRYIAAYDNLAWLYWEGRGVPQDAEKAINLYAQGADAGSGEAMNNLGMLYWNLQQHDNAEAWFRKSARAGYEPGRENLRRVEKKSREAQHVTQPAPLPPEMKAIGEEFLKKVLDKAIARMDKKTHRD